MPRVFIPAALRDLSAGQTDLTVDADTLGGVIAALDARFPGMAARLCRNEALAPGLAASIDGNIARGLLDRVPVDSEIHFLPAIGGG